MKASLIGALCLGLTACTTLTVTPPPQDEIDRFAIAFLDSIQAESIAARREVCGYIFLNRSGQLGATEPRLGTVAGCEMPSPAFLPGVIASYHTHGAYAPEYDNEVPSTRDLKSDIRLGLNGYVSTPGGRVWRTNDETASTQQICGLGCVTTDPGFVPFQESLVLPVFTLDQLRIRTGG